ncbi:MAG: hypothetical protein ACRENF_03110 [Thermodesulfobacteriota bacterium]
MPAGVCPVVLGFLFLEEAYNDKSKANKNTKASEVSGNAFNAVFHEDGVGEDGEDEEKDGEFTHYIFSSTHASA